MSDQPNWKKCKDCCNAMLSSSSNHKISQENQLSCGNQMRELQGTINLSTLCDKCIITPCSVCKKIISTPRMEISNFNEEPICTECKNIQCYRCGEEGHIKTWYNWIMCEMCGMALCNNCDGECRNPCQKCERACDNCICADYEDSDSKSVSNKYNYGC